MNIRAFQLGLIPADTVYKAAFETIGSAFPWRICHALFRSGCSYDKNRLSAYLSEEELAEEKVNRRIPL